MGFHVGDFVTTNSEDVDDVLVALLAVTLVGVVQCHRNGVVAKCETCGALNQNVALVVKRSMVVNNSLNQAGDASGLRADVTHGYTLGGQ